MLVVRKHASLCRLEKAYGSLIYRRKEASSSFCDFSLGLQTKMASYDKPTPIYASTYRYKDRLQLEGQDYYAYSVMKTRTQGTNVWNRLTDDAKLRRSTLQSIGSYREGATATMHLGSNSGFASNSQRPAAVYTHDTFKAGAYPAGPPLEQLHSMVAAKMKKKDPVQYFVSARPEAETTAQTMRMFGTYPIDAPRANQIGAFIPHMCPGGKPSYHPDVTTGNYGLKPTLPRMGFGSTLTDGRNLK